MGDPEHPACSWWRLDEHGVMYWGTDFDSGLRRHTAGEVQHFGPVSLQQKVAQEPGVRVAAGLHGPAEY